MRLFLLALIFAFAFSNLAFACTVPLSDDKQLKVHDVVFSGTLEGCFTEGKVSFKKYSVNRIWKGDIKKEFSDIVPECRHGLISKAIGGTFLIFANKIENSHHLQANSTFCNPNRPLKTRIPTYVLGFPLPHFFDKTRPEDQLEDLGTPIHTFETED